MLPTPTSSAMLLYKVNSSTTARMRGRLVLNGSTEIRGSFGEISGDHVSEATVHCLQTMVPLSAGDTVELQGTFRVADGYFAAGHTSFWTCPALFPPHRLFSAVICSNCAGDIPPSVECLLRIL